MLNRRKRWITRTLDSRRFVPCLEPLDGREVPALLLPILDRLPIDLPAPTGLVATLLETPEPTTVDLGLGGLSAAISANLPVVTPIVNGLAENGVSLGLGLLEVGVSPAASSPGEPPTPVGIGLGLDGLGIGPIEVSLPLVTVSVEPGSGESPITIPPITVPPLPEVPPITSPLPTDPAGSTPSLPATPAEPTGQLPTDQLPTDQTGPGRTLPGAVVQPGNAGVGPVLATPPALVALADTPALPPTVEQFATDAAAALAGTQPISFEVNPSADSTSLDRAAMPAVPVANEQLAGVPGAPGVVNTDSPPTIAIEPTPEPAPSGEATVDAAELLNQFLPFDPAAAWAEAQGLVAGLTDALPEAEDVLTLPETWYAVVAVVGLYAAYRRTGGRRRLVRRRQAAAQACEASPAPAVG